MKAPYPSNESKRLEAVRRYRVLDTRPEQSYDDITTLVSTLCATPVAFISLVDEGRQWFKSKTGFDAVETERDVSFCAHTVLGNDLLIVPDALQDTRFAQGPLTLGPPFIRFYAGMPLVSPGGYALGALCVVDRQPRTLSAEQEQALRALGRQVVQLLELRRSSMELAESLAEVKVLKRMLPTCSYCKRIRDDAGDWSELEAYIRTHTASDFTHGICPVCAKEHFGQLLPQPPDPSGVDPTLIRSP